MIWVKNGKILVNTDGTPMDCPDCPCSPCGCNGDQPDLDVTVSDVPDYSVCASAAGTYTFEEFSESETACAWSWLGPTTTIPPDPPAEPPDPDPVYQWRLRLFWTKTGDGAGTWFGYLALETVPEYLFYEAPYRLPPDPDYVSSLAINCVEGLLEGGFTLNGVDSGGAHSCVGGSIVVLLDAAP